MTLALTSNWSAFIDHCILFFSPLSVMSIYKSVTVSSLTVFSSQQLQLPPLPRIHSWHFSKICLSDRRSEIYRKICYLNHGRSEAAFGNNDTPIGRNDSTCRNVFSLCLNDSRHAAFPLSALDGCTGHSHACTHTPITHRPPTHPSTHIRHFVFEYSSRRRSKVSPYYSITSHWLVMTAWPRETVRPFLQM